MAVSEITSRAASGTEKNLEEYPFLVAGEWRKGTPYTVLCPYDGTPVATVHRAGPEDLEAATKAAVRAFATTRKLPAHRRAAILRDIAGKIKDRSEELAHAMALEAGKPVKHARIEVGRA